MSSTQLRPQGIYFVCRHSNIGNLRPRNALGVSCKTSDMTVNANWERRNIRGFIKAPVTLSNWERRNIRGFLKSPVTLSNWERRNIRGFLKSPVTLSNWERRNIRGFLKSPVTLSNWERRNIRGFLKSPVTLWRRNERTGETEDPRENPPTNGIVRARFPTCEDPVTRPGIEPGSPLEVGERADRSRPPRPLTVRNEPDIFRQYLDDFATVHYMYSGYYTIPAAVLASCTSFYKPWCTSRYTSRYLIRHGRFIPSLGKGVFTRSTRHAKNIDPVEPVLYRAMFFWDFGGRCYWTRRSVNLRHLSSKCCDDVCLIAGDELWTTSETTLQNVKTTRTRTIRTRSHGCIPTVCTRKYQLNGDFKQPCSSFVPCRTFLHP
ncbi:hypothetical protein PR048_023040 [Dryococelus australis]|uniref:Uncharacterized protein n=1 Tax=Dryococelus australis TaxID=614101 RepID=A0ABQ9GSX6_9NEOP|nr:hypothetical protein PR048_023040 [Dryococelus australis]